MSRESTKLPEKEFNDLESQMKEAIDKSLSGKGEYGNISEEITDMLWNLFGDKIHIDDYGQLDQLLTKQLKKHLIKEKIEKDELSGKLMETIKKRVTPQEHREPGKMSDVTEEQFRELESLLNKVMSEFNFENINLDDKFIVDDIIDEIEDVIWDYLEDRLFKYEELEFQMNRLISDQLTVYEVDTKQTVTEIMKVLRQLKKDEIETIQ